MSDRPGRVGTTNKGKGKTMTTYRVRSIDGTKDHTYFDKRNADVVADLFRALGINFTYTTQEA